jgi:ribonuclease D
MTTTTELKSLSFMHLRNVKRHANSWIAATLRAHELPETELPPLKLPATGPPAPRNWESRNPQAWKRLEFARAALAEIAMKLELPTENLMTPETVRKVLWAPPETPSELETVLAQLNARPWQIEIVAPVLETAIWQLPTKVEVSEL